MSDSAAEFVGSIPEEYDRGLGPVIFIDYAESLAARVASFGPKRVLETAAGSGIVSHCLQVHLSPDAVLTVTDLNPPMLDVARRKFDRADRVEFQSADATDLPFSNDLYDAVVCQFGVMFFPDKDRSYREVHRVLRPGGRYHFSVWDAHLYNPFGRLMHEVVGSFFPSDPPQFYKVPFGYSGIDPIRNRSSRLASPASGLMWSHSKNRSETSRALLAVWSLETRSLDKFCREVALVRRALPKP